MNADMDGFHCLVPIEVQFRDLDAMRHVNNATYFSYFETARMAYFRTIWDGPLRLEDLRTVLVDAACRYRSPALLGELLDCGIRVSHLRHSSFAFEYRMRCRADGRLVAEGRTIQSGYDHEANRVIPLGDTLRGQIERFEGRLFDAKTPIPLWGR